MPSDAPGVVDATDEVYQNNLKSEAKRIEREDAAVIRDVMSTRQGRAWMARWFKRCCINLDPYAKGDTHETARNLGAQWVGTELYKQVTLGDLDLYMLMLREDLAEVDRQEKELKKRNDKAEGRGDPPPTVKDQMPDLPPPRGWEGHVAPTPEAPPAVPNAPQQGPSEFL